MSLCKDQVTLAVSHASSGWLKTTLSRRGEYSFTADQMAEIDYRLDALRPHFRA